MKIVVGYKTGSAAGKSVVVQAIRYAKISGGTIYILTSAVSNPESKVAEVAENELKDAKAFAEQEGVQAETHFLIRGLTPGEDLVRYAKDQQADLVVVGIEKKSKVGKFVFGSSAQYVILEAPCPVLTVK